MVSEYGNPQPGSPEMDFLCPVRRLDRMKAAMMVQQGLKDIVVNPEETQQIIDDFKRRGVPIETQLFPDEGHAISKRDNQIKSTVSMVEFFAKTLKPEPL
jgi:dipeptidyl aminopeptidase/acylaminoacyl peptidase